MLEPVISVSPEQISVIPKFSQIKYIYVLPIRPFFEIRIGPNLIWENFGTTEMCSGLIDITGSRTAYLWQGV